MQINKEKIKSYAKTAWNYYVKWAYLKRHLKLFSLYIGAVSSIIIGISRLRVGINNNPDSASSFEIFIGENGWPEVCIILLVTIAFIVIAYMMEKKSYLAQAEHDYRKKMDASLQLPIIFSRRD